MRTRVSLWSRSIPKFAHLPIIISEADPEGCAACSSKVNPSNNYRNGTLYPVYTAARIKELFALQDRHKVNLIAMLSWSFEFEDKDYFEGFRSLSTNGVDKPVLNVFRMAGLMSGNGSARPATSSVPLDTLTSVGVRQAPDVDAFATRAGNGAAVLVWNYHDVNEPGSATPAVIKISGIPGGVHRVLLKHFRIDETHSNAYSVWQQMGSPQHPDERQYARLQAAGQLQLLSSPSWLDVTNGTVEIAADMPRESISLLRLEW